MVSYINISDIKPAQYNPRKIDEKQFEMLKNSIKDLGYVIPILVNKQNNVIIAGHQRTKAGIEVGVKEVPCFYVEDITVADEIKFNQIHNGVDRKENIFPKVHGEITQEGFTQIDHKCIDDFRPMNSQYVKEMCKLIMKYGNVLCAVVSDNKVILHSNYVKACKLLKIDVNAYHLPSSKKETAKRYFEQDYGRYSYEHLKKDTYVQGLAQMYRLSDDKNKKQNQSALYETMVIPYIKEKHLESMLDFGCGKAAYVNKLKKCMKATGIEFYNNNRVAINVTKGHQMIDELIDNLKNDGLFDIVVCDSVLNSVDSIEAENSVLACLCLFSKKYVAFSGRTYEFIEKVENQKTASDTRNYLYFCDNDKFTANYRQGKWYYQHFHAKEDVIKLCERFKLKIIYLNFNTSSSWQCLCEKIEELDNETYKKAVDFEFNLPLPNGSYQRNEDVKKALYEIGVF